MYNPSDYSRQMEIINTPCDNSRANFGAKTRAANWLRRYALPVHEKFSQNKNPKIAQFHASELEKIAASLKNWEAEINRIFA